MKKAKVGIVGAAGYVGGEMIRLLIHHPSCELTYVNSKSQAGRAVSDIHPDLKGWTDLIFKDEYPTNLNIIFLCSGHGNSKTFIEEANLSQDCLLIDLSRDYRLKDENAGFIYGLCELNKSKIKKAKLIANPGCFATCIQLALLPLASSQLLNSEVHITAITGSTGAGQNPVSTTHNSWRNNNISIYKAFAHQHLDEIIQSVKQLQPSFSQDINFIPMRGSFTRGIFASLYFDSELDEKEVKDLFSSYYQDSPFVHLSDVPISVKDVVNTNNALIHISKSGSKIRIESAIDNLLKGAAGQAVQNMNLAMGWDEKKGLKLKGSAF